MIVCRIMTTWTVVAAMCIEYRTIHNSIGRVLELLTAKRVTLDRTQFIIYQQAWIICVSDNFWPPYSHPDCGLH